MFIVALISVVVVVVLLDATTNGMAFAKNEQLQTKCFYAGAFLTIFGALMMVVADSANLLS